jgi:RNA polymerase sigma factor (sigma-70 family)
MLNYLNGYDYLPWVRLICFGYPSIDKMNRPICLLLFSVTDYMLTASSTSAAPVASQGQSVSSDQLLLQACQRGDAAAWEQLLQKYERLVFSVARTCGLAPEDAADITQLTFTYLLQSLDSVQPDRLGGWLATVARRHSWRVRKRQQRTSTVEVDVEGIDELFPQQMADRPIERWELAEWLHSGLAQLGERCQRLLIALYLDSQEYGYREIAEMLGMPEGSIGPTRARCLTQLRQLLSETKQK